MAGDTFWNNRDQAQKLIDEGSTLRRKVDPLLKAERQHEDFKVMIELGESEPEPSQAAIQAEVSRDLVRFMADLGQLELKVFLNGPHDANNCILSINAGAGGTESCDWASMLLRMYQRWSESRGWGFEVTDALPGECGRHQERYRTDYRRKRLWFCQSRTGCSPLGADISVRFE
jgi:peptide chain release factor 2